GWRCIAGAGPPLEVVDVAAVIDNGAAWVQQSGGAAGAELQNAGIDLRGTRVRVGGVQDQGPGTKFGESAGALCQRVVDREGVVRVVDIEAGRGIRIDRVRVRADHHRGRGRQGGAGDLQRAAVEDDRTWSAAGGAQVRIRSDA